MKSVWQRYGDVRARRRVATPSNLYEDVQMSIRNTVPIASKRWIREPNLSYLKPLIEEAKQAALDAERSTELSGAHAWSWLRLLVLQAPQASLAQVQMDKHPHGYHSRGARLYELIDFNDAFVSTVLALPDSDLTRFADEAKRLMDWFCKRVGVRIFSDEQYQAIVQGLTKEIAVFLGVQQEGLKAEMTNRASDALGVDMVISDPQTGKSVNIDCKSPSSYRHRIYDLLREGRLSEEEVTAAETLGFIAEINGHGGERTKVVLWRIDPETYGEIQDFTFVDTSMLGTNIQSILQIYGE
jgi:hypothetical protein